MAEQAEIDELPAGLIDIIEKEFPDTSRPEKSRFGVSKRSEYHSVRLNDSNREPLIAFGLGPSADAYKRVRSAAIELQRALAALEADGLRELNWAAPFVWETGKTPLGQEAYYVAHCVKNAASELIEKRKHGYVASRKRDWCSAALAKTARRIWAEEKWLADPDRYGPPVINALAEFLLPEHDREAHRIRRQMYEDHLRDFAPRSEKQYAPGPFGRFLEEVLNLYGRDTSAASALRSMRQAEETIAQGLQKRA